jgi:hypothetical protein
MASDGSRLDLDLPEGAFGSCGRPFDGVEVRIADAESGELGSPADVPTMATGKVDKSGLQRLIAADGVSCARAGSRSGPEAS